MLLHSFDASSPPSGPPAGYDIALGYIGGLTPHVWTPDEWRRFGNMKQAPIFVYGRSLDPIVSGANAGNDMVRLGFTPNAPVRRFCVIDMEATDNDPWVSQFAAELAAVGFDTVKYNSETAGLELPAHVVAEWVALWNDQQNVPAQAVAHQYAANIHTPQGVIDASVWDSSFADHFGWGPRKG